MDEIVQLRDVPGFGLLSRAQPSGGDLAIVLLSAGVVHRVGPFRIYVDLARRLAAEGIDVFRFDLPRVGDGPSQGASVEATVTAALDAVQRETGASRFAIGGLCSAADLAWRTAQNEPRVCGLLMLDGFAHRGLWFRVGRLRRALARPLRQWPATALRRLRRPKAGIGAVTDQALRDWPEPGAFRQQAEAMVQQGVQILAIYTGGVSKYLLHPRQLRDTFGEAYRDTALELHFWPWLDHTLLSPVGREPVLATIAAWCHKWSHPLAVGASG